MTVTPIPNRDHLLPLLRIEEAATDLGVVFDCLEYLLARPDTTEANAAAYLLGRARVHLADIGSAFQAALTTANATTGGAP